MCGSQCVLFHCAWRFDTRARHREPRSCVRCSRRCPRPARTREGAADSPPRPSTCNVSVPCGRCNEGARPCRRRTNSPNALRRGSGRQVCSHARCADAEARAAASSRKPWPGPERPRSCSSGPQPPWPRGLGLLSPAGVRRGGGGGAALGSGCAGRGSLAHLRAAHPLLCGRAPLRPWTGTRARPPVCSWGVGDSCSRGPQSPVAPLSLCSVPSDSDPRPPSHKDPCDSVRLTQALQDGVSISRSLSHWERPCCRMRSRVPGFAGLGRERRRGLLLGPPPPGCAVPFCARGPSVRVGGAHPPLCGVSLSCCVLAPGRGPSARGFPWLSHVALRV